MRPNKPFFLTFITNVNRQKSVVFNSTFESNVKMGTDFFFFPVYASYGCENEKSQMNKDELHKNRKKIYTNLRPVFFKFNFPIFN